MCVCGVHHNFCLEICSSFQIPRKSKICSNTFNDDCLVQNPCFLSGNRTFLAISNKACLFEHNMHSALYGNSTVLWSLDYLPGVIYSNVNRSTISLHGNPVTVNHDDCFIGFDYLNLVDVRCENLYSHCQCYWLGEHNRVLEHKSAVPVHSHSQCQKAKTTTYRS